MLIYKHVVPNALIKKYCKIIIALEKQYHPNLELIRSQVHNEIFDYVGWCRDLHKREDREFNKALNMVILDLTYNGD